MTVIDRVVVRTATPQNPPAKGVGTSTLSPLSGVAGAARLSRAGDSAGLTPGATWAVVVTVIDDEGFEGSGTCGFGHPATVPVLKQLAGWLVGRDVDAIAEFWESAYRATLNVGRRGVAMHALSGVDIALWDLLSRRLGVPLHTLFGGPVRDRQPVYASFLYATEDLDALATEARRYVDLGCLAVKQRLSGGPLDGINGIRRNVELIRTVRDAVGPDVEVMADAYMGWDLGFAVRCLRAIEDAGLRLRWFEEPLIPDDLRSYVALRHAVSTPIAAGEHEATRYGFRELLTEGAVDVIQPDANRLGGVSEARRVWALGESFGVDVVAHLGVAHNLHLTVASQASPLAEWMPPPAPGTDPDEDQLLFALSGGHPTVRDGTIAVPRAAGLGVEIDDELLTVAWRSDD